MSYLYRGRPGLDRLNARIMADRERNPVSQPGHLKTFEWRMAWRPSVSRGSKAAGLAGRARDAA